jgi:hypothetical protein
LALLQLIPKMRIPSFAGSLTQEKGVRTGTSGNPVFCDKNQHTTRSIVDSSVWICPFFRKKLLDIPIRGITIMFSFLAEAARRRSAHFVVAVARLRTIRRNNRISNMMPVRHRLWTAVAIVALTTLPIQRAFAAFGFGIDSFAGINVPTAPPPPDVKPGNPNGSQESALPFLFYEVIGGSLVNPLPVDHNGLIPVVANPIISGNVVNPLLSPTTIASDTKFNSYLFHFDPTGIPSFPYVPFPFYVADIKFENQVLGVQLFSNAFVLQKPAGNPYTGTLESGDAAVAAAGGPPIAYYPGGDAFRGVEEDFFQIVISGTEVVLAGKAFGTEIDQVRIITASPVPEPASIITWVVLSLFSVSGVLIRRMAMNSCSH